MKRTIISFAVAALLGTSAHAGCTITYNCGTGATGTKPANQSITAATKVFTPSAPGTCAKSGQVFSHWQVSSTSGYLNGGGYGTMYDAAWAGTEYTIPFTEANKTCSDTSLNITLTAQWIDASYTGIPTSKSYVDTGLNAKQPKFAGLGKDKLMLYSDTTNGAVTSRDIVTTLGDSTTATTVPTSGAINTGLATKQDTLNGTAGWVVEGSGTAGYLFARPVYSTTDNYKNALVEAEDLNQMVIDAVNSELTQVADGWRINDSVTMAALRTYINLDPTIDTSASSVCARTLDGNGHNGDDDCWGAVLTKLGATNSKNGMWSEPFSYGQVYGKSVCSSISASEKYTTATSSQSATMDTEYTSQAGNGNITTDQKYCWCKVAGIDGTGFSPTAFPNDTPVDSLWVSYGDYWNSISSSTDCKSYCAEECGANVRASDNARTAMFNAIQ